MTGAILAGGKSSRFGENKALYPIKGRFMIEWISDTIKKFTEELFIVANDTSKYSFLDVPVHEDRFPGCGPLAGLHTALIHTNSDQVLILACDMPFLNPALIKIIINAAGSHDVVVPYTARGPEPLHAIYHKNLLRIVEQLLMEGRHSMKDLLSSAPHQKLYFPGHEFINLNTKKELEKALQLYDKCNSN